MVVEGETVSVVRLAPMMFQLGRYLAAAMREEIHLQRPPARQGWVSTRELMDNLPGLAPEVTPESIHKLFTKLGQQMQEAGAKPNLFEQNDRGSYRMAADPMKILLELPPSGKI